MGWLPADCSPSQKFLSPWPSCYLPRGPSTRLVTVEELGTFLSSLCGFRMRRTVWAQSPPSGFRSRRRRGSDEDSMPSRTKRRLPIFEPLLTRRATPRLCPASRRGRPPLLRQSSGLVNSRSFSVDSIVLCGRRTTTTREILVFDWMKCWRREGRFIIMIIGYCCLILLMLLFNCLVPCGWIMGVIILFLLHLNRQVRSLMTVETNRDDLRATTSYLHQKLHQEQLGIYEHIMDATTGPNAEILISGHGGIGVEGGQLTLASRYILTSVILLFAAYFERQIFLNL